MTKAAEPACDSAAIVVRQLEEMSEFDACVLLQQSVWQFPDLDVIPRRMFLVARAIGGQIFGAFDGETLVGYALAIPGVRDGKAFMHSHMLAVLPGYRNRGIGEKLKFAQRDDALAKGLDRIEWTFDPMQIKNAYLNIEKLGAIMRRYSVDFYGASNSPLHGQLPTDRLHAEWWIRSERAVSLAEGRGMPDCTITDTVNVTYGRSILGDTLQPSLETTLVSLLNIRRHLISSFARHLAVLRFDVGPGEHARYLLGPHGE